MKHMLKVINKVYFSKKFLKIGSVEQNSGMQRMPYYAAIFSHV